jgi:RNA polymerase sigma-70 factor (ECF subfamily)
MFVQNDTTAVASVCSDNALIVQTLSGDEHAFTALVQRYHWPLYNFIQRFLKESEWTNDVLQFVFMQLYLSLPKLQHTLYSTHTKLPLKSWLFQVAWNRCIDELRKQRSLSFSELEASSDDEEFSLVNVIPDHDPLPDVIAEQHELQTTLQQAIRCLPPHFRSIVLLRYTRELSFGEIGRVLNIPENTAKTYFQRARPLLRASLLQHI